MKHILTPNAPAPGGHYSQAVVHNGTVYISGQIAIDPATGQRNLGTVESQTEQVFKNTGAILEAANSDFDHLLQVTIYISDIEFWKPVNEVYVKMLGEARPARAVIPVNDLHYGFKIEVSAIAALKD